MDHAAQAAEQDLPQRNAADRVVAVDRVGGTQGSRAPVQEQKLLEPFRVKTEAGFRLSARRDECVPALRRKAIVQSTGTCPVDMDAVSFQPVVRSPRTLIDGDACPGVLQAMSQAQPADTGADDDYMQGLFNF
jgi:hypothetical protein